MATKAASTKKDPTKITFEDGYEELKRLVAEVDNEGITVHEICEKFARGKGLEKALRTYLSEQEGKLKEIEEGTGVPEFEISAPSQGANGESEFDAQADIPSDTSDFDPGRQPEAAGSDDEIPF